MISIAITGGIGSGKSYVSALLKERGIPIYNADDEAKRLMLSDAGIRKDLVSLLGEDVYLHGELNKPLLASYLFANPENAARVNGIVHPKVKADFGRWLEAYADKEMAGLECAILFEAGFDDAVDAVVMVYAPEDLRIARAMKRDQASETQIRARIAAQMDEDEKCRQSDYVIYNDGRMSLDCQLSSMIALLKQEKK